MKEFRYRITDENGIHARPAGKLVNEVKRLGVRVTVSKDGAEADAAKLFSLMALTAKKGDELTVRVDSDGNEAAELERFFRENL